MEVHSVSDVAGWVKEVFTQEQGLQDLWVEGEVAGCKIAASGHCYFTLKDDRAALQAVMFRVALSRVRFQMQDGMVILAHGKLDFYGDRGQTQLILDAAQPSGVGALYLAFEQLKAKLDAEGLFAAHLKRQLPYLPRRVAVVTSEAGAAMRDVIKVIRRRCGIVGVVVAHAPVQGLVSPTKLILSLQRAAALPEVDVVLLVRGGGSLEDLASFNDEKLARAIRACPVPVVTGIGHETDFTIADFAADVRAATPSQAAELAVPDLADMRRHLLQLRHRLDSSLPAFGRQRDLLRELRDRLDGAVAREAATKRERLESATARLSRQSPGLQLPLMRQRVDDRVERLDAALRVGLERARAQLVAGRAQLEALSPLRVLGRGYSLARTEDGVVVTSVARLEVGQRLVTVFADGRAVGELVSVEKVPARAGREDDDA
ncbi:MAG: exodeoxyribonuclease large subunit [Chloroflexota bacterium]|jgi:exodeoxyribonuclease VII large subunit|nr:exodeoxyribonuclease large subunit [Chloroflexota bacterium]